ncbi:undecaprenyl-diphosphate phosphatase [Candidatus Margulisiibacteriota bacterium]
MSIFESILLGIVQGLTEFLPVSSSGHLVITSNILGLKPDLAFITVVHFATLLAVLVYFFKDMILLTKNFFGGLFGLILKKKKISETYDDPYFKIATLIIVGTIPTVIIALSFKDWFEMLFNSLLAVGCFLIITGIIIMHAERISRSIKSEKEMSMLDAIYIGVFQGMAVAPGLSRSGLTVSASLLRGLKRPLAARFAFLLSIPAIVGATIYELKDIMELSFKGVGAVPLLLGVVSAFISGYFAIGFFIGLIKKKKISIFAYYCFIVGSFVVLKSFF